MTVTKTDARINVRPAIGIQAAEVNSINEAAERFYGKSGFLSITDAPHHLLLPVKVIREL